MSSIKLESNASGTGVFTIASPNSNTNRTLSIPDATGTINTSGAVNEVPAGSASAPSIYPTGDTNTGIFFPAADTIAFAEGGAEIARFDSSGNLGIGTASPESFGGGHKTLELSGSTNTEGGVFKTATSGSAGSGSTGTEMLMFTDSVGGKINVVSAHPAIFYTANTERMRIDSSGNLLFNSGYGSVATAYGCRAWVNFNGSANTNLSGTYSQSGTTVTVTATAHGLIVGSSINADITSGTGVDGIYTVATVPTADTFTYTAGTSLTTSGNVTLLRNTIRASGNVSSITDNATGDYTVNFATAMPDANYAVSYTRSFTSVAPNGTRAHYTIAGSQTTTSVRIAANQGNASTTAEDVADVSVAIFR